MSSTTPTVVHVGVTLRQRPSLLSTVHVLHSQGSARSGYVQATWGALSMGAPAPVGLVSAGPGL